MGHRASGFSSEESYLLQSPLDQVKNALVSGYTQCYAQLAQFLLLELQNFNSFIRKEHVTQLLAMPLLF